MPDDLATCKPSFHPDGVDVLIVLEGVLVKDPHLGEAQLAVQGDRRIIRQDNARECDVNRLVSERSEQHAAQRGTYALAAPADAECNADFHGLPEAFMIPIGWLLA